MVEAVDRVMDDSTRVPEPPQAVRFKLTSPDTGEPYTIEIDVVQARTLSEIVTKWGVGPALDLLLFGASVARCAIAETDVTHLKTVLERLPHSTLGQAGDLEDWVLWRTYTWLREKQVTRAQAAKYAEDILQKPVSTDGWRMAVDRWAAKRHWPKVEYRTRHTSKGHDKG
jgi:hypothetical protein